MGKMVPIDLFNAGVTIDLQFVKSTVFAKRSKTRYGCVYLIFRV